jgi:hypothetical protein
LFSQTTAFYETSKGQRLFYIREGEGYHEMNMFGPNNEIRPLEQTILEM